MPESHGGARPSRSRYCSAALAPPLLVAAAVVLWPREAKYSFGGGWEARGPAQAPKDRRLLGAEQAPAGSSYTAVNHRVFCNDSHSLLFDNLKSHEESGYRIQAECEEQCNTDSLCRFMLWGWSPRGYYHCATFRSCDKFYPYEEGEPTVFERRTGQESKHEDREPHAMWVGGAYTDSTDPLTMEFCSLSDGCDVFGPVAPLPLDGDAHSGCADKGGRWCSVRPPLDELFSPVDGGDGRACRRTSENDNSKVYYHIKKLGTTASFSECLGLCLAHGDCTGIEHIAFLKEHRCEIWQTRIMATLPLKIATCLRHVNWMDAPNCCLKGSCGACEELGKLGAQDEEACVGAGGQWCDPAARWYGLFAPVDGGIDRACRGAEAWDNDESYYTTHTLGLEDSIDRCKHLCLDDAKCKGIEYMELSTGPQCKLWTRPAGVRASAHSEGSTCLRWTR